LKDQIRDSIEKEDGEMGWRNNNRENKKNRKKQ
jgi:hypothetical protein